MKILLTPLLLILVVVLTSSCTQKNEIETGVSGLVAKDIVCNNDDKYRWTSIQGRLVNRNSYDVSGHVHIQMYDTDNDGIGACHLGYSIIVGENSGKSFKVFCEETSCTGMDSVKIIFK